MRLRSKQESRIWGAACSTSTLMEIQSPVATTMIQHRDATEESEQSIDKTRYTREE